MNHIDPDRALYIYVELILCHPFQSRSTTDCYLLMIPTWLVTGILSTNPPPLVITTNIFDRFCSMEADESTLRLQANRERNICDFLGHSDIYAITIPEFYHLSHLGYGLVRRGENFSLTEPTPSSRGS